MTDPATSNIIRIGGYITPQGTFAKSGSSKPTPCPAGSYNDLPGKADCTETPPGYFTLLNSSSYADNIGRPGYYYPAGTKFSTEFPCPRGTYSNVTGIISASDCVPSPPGTASLAIGLPAPNAKCGPGHYCLHGADTMFPNDGVSGGKCSPGYVCKAGAATPTPSDGITGYPAPSGTYSGSGSSVEVGCEPGTFNPSHGASSCMPCPGGTFCTGSTITPEPCPVHKYCPESTFQPILCLNGTYSNSTGLTSSSECLPCIGGHYCRDGRVSGKCAQGYFCRSGMSSPTPSVTLQNDTQMTDVTGFWASLNGGQCPPGHFCPHGTVDPFMCQNKTMRADTHGVSADDCGPCPAGYICTPGNPVPERCLEGYYCEANAPATPCPVGTYQPNREMKDRSACLNCPPGYLCNEAAISDMSRFPCPVGSYCVEKALDAIDCPPGTYRNTINGQSVSDCFVCPGGKYCGNGTVTPVSCRPGETCAAGSAYPELCPARFYCPGLTSAPIPCEAGFYCPQNSSAPIRCPRGTFCPPNSYEASPCPLGSVGKFDDDSSRVDLSNSCELCPAGTYGVDPDRRVCAPCEAGYVCHEGCRNKYPTDVAKDKGYQCPKGHYCPTGSAMPFPCPPGSHNPTPLGGSMTDCLLCSANLYQHMEGQSECYSCSTSSVSSPGSASCKCLGLNRAFQTSDGFCICKPGYEFYDENFFKQSDEDGDVDCQPVVYNRCLGAQVRDLFGNCRERDDCELQCGASGGRYVQRLGICECNLIDDLGTVCDEDCREDSEFTIFDPDSNELVVMRGNVSSVSRSITEIEGFTGKIDCLNSISAESSSSPGCTPYEPSCASNYNCNVFNMEASDAGFIGLYGSVLSNNSSSSGFGGRRLLTTQQGSISAELSSRLENPVVCLQLGDSVLYKVSNEKYPQYEKDSLLNTNAKFDYGAFRDLDDLAKSKSTVSFFGFTFSEPGIYVFSMSDAPEQLSIVAVMEDSVACSTKATFTPLTEANLVAINAKKESKLILEPDWLIISCLIIGLLTMIFGVVGTLYYFRTLAWKTRGAAKPKYRLDSLKSKVDKFHDKGNIFKHDAKILPTGDEEGGDDMFPDDDLDTPGPKRQRTGDSDYGADDGGDFRGFSDAEFEAREIINHIQRHHDIMEKEFLNQHELTSNLHQALKDEADELKQIIAESSQEGLSGSSSSSSTLSASKALLSRIKTECAARRLHEGSGEANEATVFTMIKRLSDILDSGAQPVAEDIVSEVKNQEPPDKSGSLEAICKDLVDMKNYINKEIVAALDSEKRRLGVIVKSWDATIKTHPAALDEKVTTLLSKCRRGDIETDYESEKLSDALSDFSRQIPAFCSALLDNEGVLVRNLVAEPHLEEKIVSRSLKSFCSLLKQLRDKMLNLFEAFGTARSGVDSSRADVKETRKDLEEAVEIALAEVEGRTYTGGRPKAVTKLSDDTIQGIKELSQNASLDEIQTKLKGEQLAAKELEEERARERKNELLKTLEAKDDMSQAEKEEILGTIEQDRKEMEEALDLERLRQEEELKQLVKVSDGDEADDVDVKNEEAKQEAANDLIVKQRREMDEALEREAFLLDDDDPRHEIKILHMDEINAIRARNALERRRKVADLIVRQERTRIVVLTDQSSSAFFVQNELSRLDEEESKARSSLCAAIDNSLQSNLESCRNRQKADIKGGVEAEAIRKLLQQQCDMTMEDLLTELDDRLHSGSHAVNKDGELSLERVRSKALLSKIGNSQRLTLLSHMGEIEEDYALSFMNAIDQMDMRLFEQHTEAGLSLIEDEEEKAKFKMRSHLSQVEMAEAQRKRNERTIRYLRSARVELQRSNAGVLVALASFANNLLEQLDSLCSKTKQYEKSYYKVISARAEKEKTFDVASAKSALEQGSNSRYDDLFRKNLPEAVAGLLLGSGGSVQDDDDNARAAALKKLHEKELKEVKFAIQRDSKRAKDSLKAKLASRRSQREEELKEKGLPADALKKEMEKLEEADGQEMVELLRKLEDVGAEKVEAELRRQRQRQAEAGFDPKEELARLLVAHADGLTNLRSDLEAEKKSRHELLKARLAAKRKAKKKEMFDKGVANTELEAELASFDVDAAIEEQQLLASLDRTNESSVAATLQQYARAEKAAEDLDSELQRVRKLHAQNIGSLTASMTDKQRQSRMSLEEKLKLRRAKKLQELEKFNPTLEEVQNAEEEISAQNFEDLRAFDESCSNDVAEMIAKEKLRQAEAIKSGDSFESELQRLKKLHQDRLKDLKRETDSSMKDRKAALRKRLEENRRKKELLMKNKGCKEEDIKATLANLESAHAEEERAAVSRMEQDARRVLERAESASGSISKWEGPVPLADDSDEALEKLKSLHKKELENLQMCLNHEAASGRQKLMAKLAAKRAEKMAMLAERGANETQVEAAEKLLVNQSKTAIAKLEMDTQRRGEEALSALADTQNAAIGGIGSGVDFDLELARVKQMHGAGLSDLEAQLAHDKRERREQLRKRLEAQKRARMAKMKQRGLEDEEIDQEVERIASENKEEMQRLEVQLQNENDEIEGFREAANPDGGAEAGATEEDLVRLKSLHERELQQLKAKMEEENRRQSEQLLAELAALKEKKILQVIEKGGGEEEIEVVVQGMENEAALAMNQLTVSQKKEAAERMQVETEKQKDREDMASLGDFDYDAYLIKMKADNSKDMLALQHSLESDKAKRKSALREKLNARRKAREAKAKAAAAGQDGGDEIVKAAILSEDAEAALELQKLDSTLTRDQNKAIDEFAQQRNVAEGKVVDQSALIAKLEAQHQREIEMLRAEMAAEKEALTARLNSDKIVEKAQVKAEMQDHGATQEEIDRKMDEIDARVDENVELETKLQGDKLEAKVEMKKRDYESSYAKQVSDNERLLKLKSQNEEDVAAMKAEMSKKRTEKKNALKARLEKRRKAKMNMIDREGGKSEKEKALAVQDVLSHEKDEISKLEKELEKDEKRQEREISTGLAKALQSEFEAHRAGNEAMTEEITKLKELNASNEAKLQEEMKRVVEANSRQLEEAMTRKMMEMQKLLEGLGNVERDQKQKEIEFELKDEAKSKLNADLQERRKSFVQEELKIERKAMEEARVAVDEAAKEAEEEAKRKLEEEERRAKLEKLKREEAEKNESRKGDIAAQKSKQKQKLAERLKEKRKKELKKKQEQQLENLRKVQEDDEKIARKMARADTMKMKKAKTMASWEVAVENTRSELSDPSSDLSESEVEQAIISMIGDGEMVPEVFVQKAVEKVFAGRHNRETSALLSSQYKKRSEMLRQALNKVFDDKSIARKQLLLMEGLSEGERNQRMSELNEEFSQKAEDAEREVGASLEESHMQQQIALRQQQLEEIRQAHLATTTKSEEELANEAKRAEEEMRLEHDKIEKEKAEKIAVLEEEKRLALEKIEKEKMEAMRELELSLSKEQESVAKKMEEERQRMEKKHKDDLESRMNELSNEANDEEKNKLIEQFKEEQSRQLDALELVKNEKKRKLEEKLAARREKKRLALEKKKKNMEVKNDKQIELVEKVAHNAVAVSSVMALGGGDDEGRQARKKFRVAGKKLMALSRMGAKRSLISKSGGLGGELEEGAVAGGGSPARPAWIGEKLASIERSLEALSKSVLTNAQGGVGAVAGGASASYQDPRDVLLLPLASNKLVPRTDENLTTVEKVRLNFAKSVAQLVNMEDSVVIKIADSLPRSSYFNNAFRNSYYYDNSCKTLYMHVDRFGSQGDIMLCLVHALSHIKVNPENLADDSAPSFASEYNRELKIVTNELASGGGSLAAGQKRRRLSSTTRQDNFSMGDLKESAGVDTEEDFFSEAAMVERMQRYAQLAGGGKVGEMIGKWGEKESMLEGEDDKGKGGTSSKVQPDLAIDLSDDEE